MARRSIEMYEYRQALMRMASLAPELLALGKGASAASGIGA